MGLRMANSLALGLVVAFSLWHSILSFMDGNGAFWSTRCGRTETLKAERIMESSTSTSFEVIVPEEVVN